MINYLACNIEKETFPFECSFCNFSGPRRDNLFLHLKCTHLDEITPKIENFNESKHVKIPDCGNKICKKLFGLNRPHLFCEKCTDKEPKKYWQKRTLCTLCGQSVQTIAMKEHMIVAHNKGQLISEWLLDVFIWTKKQTKIFLSCCLPLWNRSNQKRMQNIILKPNYCC